MWFSIDNCARKMKSEWTLIRLLTLEQSDLGIYCLHFAQICPSENLGSLLYGTKAEFVQQSNNRTSVLGEKFEFINLYQISNTDDLNFLKSNISIMSLVL